MTAPIIQPIKALFASVDARDWQQVRAVMDAHVLLDYSSMNGNPATNLTPGEITSAWEAFLPGFDRTQHEVSGFDIQPGDHLAMVHMRGEAQHWIGDDCWLVAGTYDITLCEVGDRWLIMSMKFNFESQGGDTSLPARAQERMKKNLSGLSPSGTTGRHSYEHKKLYNNERICFDFQKQHQRRF
ncbi:hypothetical protein DYBT9275_05487 [Dyadobacter sp. CECT 9275]|uniref:SnoaL-like domain-containing protein n=1 Tax=Dyadobacter helix TaxID=2822344 RepID=A0A916JGB7_9BACT|nr:nuclear transport factor 2 family protein [Dyadobacter sp. CECT 9275]CAG5016154.1 hypothetical protein DYBT9275_05487 [Dyadobacter sp. CECT 9275]